MSKKIVFSTLQLMFYVMPESRVPNVSAKYFRDEGKQLVLTNDAISDVAKLKKAQFLKAIG